MAESEPKPNLAIRAVAAGLGAIAGIAGPDVAILGAALTPVIEDFLGWLTGKRSERGAETLIYAADALDGKDLADNLRRIMDTAAQVRSTRSFLPVR
jgi:hypothetical protein